jgi:16S rRNA (guanine527-N7)-methyltransferase
MVLAICHPDRQFTLLDSAGKKMRFLFQVKQSLALDNVSIENRRVEAFKPEPPFDLIISRAFASIKKFTDISGHALKAKGEFWAMKGVYPEQELSEIEKHYIVAGHHSLCVPGVVGERCLIRLTKS